MSHTPKETKLLIEASLPHGESVHSASIAENGRVVFKREDGSEITPLSMERILLHERDNKSPKRRTRTKFEGQDVSIGGLEELRKFDGIFFVDTNTRKMHGKEISATCFISCQLFLRESGYQFEFENQINIYEFHDVPKKPELLAILKICNDVARSAPNHKSFAIVTDTELGLHDAINARKIPLYETYYLPNGFTLLYASADTGQEVTNKLFKCCDKEASKYLRFLESRQIKETDVSPLFENPSVLYRYMRTSEVEIGSPIFSAPHMGEGAEITLYGKK